MDRATGVKASAAAFIRGVSGQIAAAVAAALAADDAADEGTLAAVNAAIAEATAKMEASTDDLAAALTSNPGPGDPPVPSQSRR